jgi:hypothetical protein
MKAAVYNAQGIEAEIPQAPQHGTRNIERIPDQK